MSCGSPSSLRLRQVSSWSPTRYTALHSLHCTARGWEIFEFLPVYQSAKYCPEMPAGNGLAQQTMLYSGIELASAALKATATANETHDGQALQTPAATPGTPSLLKVESCLAMLAMCC